MHVHLAYNIKDTSHGAELAAINKHANKTLPPQLANKHNPVILTQNHYKNANGANANHLVICLTRVVWVSSKCYSVIGKPNRKLLQ